MGDEDEREPPGVYTLITSAGDKNNSIGYNGTGTANYPNGDVYEGVFESGARQGQGTYTYFSGDVFTGYFENNLKVGKGKITYKKGGFYHGFFKSGMREGEGTFKYANGDIYSGMWKAGKKHGKGTYVFSKTKYELKGEWNDGQMTTGTWSLTNGTKYLGNFKNQKPVGEGIWQTSQGTIVEGAYVQQVVPAEDKADSKVAANKDAPPAVATRAFWKTATLVNAEAD